MSLALVWHADLSFVFQSPLLPTPPTAAFHLTPVERKSSNLSQASEVGFHPGLHFYSLLIVCLPTEKVLMH